MIPASWIGPGIGYRHHFYDDLIAAPDPHQPLVLEIIPDHFFADPERIKPLGEKYSIVFHDIAMSVSTVDNGQLTANRLKRIRRLTEFCSPLLFSDHLAITRSPDGLDLGHLAPVPYTGEMLRHVAGQIRIWQDSLELPVALENIALPFLFDAEISEAEFFSQLVEETGCGILMDLTNLLYNARNFDRDPVELLKEYPLHAVRQIHLAGGRVSDDWWVDSHSEPVEGASYELLRNLQCCTELRTIVVERDVNVPTLSELIREAELGADTWLGHCGQP